MNKVAQLNFRIDDGLARKIRAAAALRGERMADFLERVTKSEIERLETLTNGHEAAPATPSGARVHHTPNNVNHMVMPCEQ